MLRQFKPQSKWAAPAPKITKPEPVPVDPPYDDPMDLDE